jgi:hypothetical protein
MALLAHVAPLAVEAGWAAGVAGNAPVVVVQHAIETEKLPLRDPAVETEKLRQAVGDEACSYVPADN